MSTTTITIPKEYGYVILSVAGTFFMGMWQAYRVPAFRKPAGMKYPKAFADSADMASATPEQKKAMYLFNCAQRVHGNWLENQPSVMIAMLLSGLEYPLTTTALSIGWMVFRTIYAIGYTRSDLADGKGRLPGIMGAAPFQLGLYGLATWCGIKMVM